MLIERMRKRLAADRVSFIEPCLPSPADKTPSGANWIQEIKHDGHRLNLKVFPLEIAKQIIAEHPACPSL
jgi:ATP-dependent DNA ligase